MPAEGAGVIPAHLNDRVVVEADRVRGRSAAMPPIGARHLDPAAGPDVAEAATLGIGDMTGLGDEGGELGVRHLEANELERRHRYRARGLVRPAIGIACLEAAAGNRDHLERRIGLTARDWRHRHCQHERRYEQAPEPCNSVHHRPLPSPCPAWPINSRPLAGARRPQFRHSIGTSHSAGSTGW